MRVCWWFYNYNFLQFRWGWKCMALNFFFAKFILKTYIWHVLFNLPFDLFLSYSLSLSLFLFSLLFLSFALCIYLLCTILLWIGRNFVINIELIFVIVHCGIRANWRREKHYIHSYIHSHKHTFKHTHYTYKFTSTFTRRISLQKI